ncbi:Cbs2p NDAI_0C04710 [Naumovozyma dairenensis CBS 421]|uniref:Ketopantoate reductase C-terminal domain-containing protein n=1 Tax=Naumovozyma dairenensis (strain ATCC 10597 / BCRC 20456 / CBS 421 / NBRC 0211 / NRRL Y-12639) TaxID=1071378 RepID=G0W8L9_NAUDC|nr:hypothetical protein NDAI_0C04710 [Naumovozyma dairenensis CBS 421]CCD24130.1 hypothetical protein NDAI_0C04710 [Naumovozyma dairenensis CBS 421]
MSTIIYPRIYLLGNSPISPLLAYEISRLPTQPKVPDVVLLLQDSKKLQRFLDNDSKVCIHKQDGTINEQQFMASCNLPIYSTGEIAQINNLIACETSSKSLTSSLFKYRKSIKDSTNLLLVNPPFGSIQYILDNVWKSNASNKPNIFIGMNKFNQLETKFGRLYNEFHLKLRANSLNLLISQLPTNFNVGVSTLTDHDEDAAGTGNELMKTLKETERNSRRERSDRTSLEFQMVPFEKLYQIRLERLIVQSCIDSLSLLYDCQLNNELLHIIAQPNSILMDLLNEQINILKKSYPFLENQNYSNILLSQNRLFNVVVGLLEKNATKQPMVLHLKNQLNQTPINELTGVFTRLAYTNNINCKWNKMVTELVRGKLSLLKKRSLNYHYL